MIKSKTKIQSPLNSESTIELIEEISVDAIKIRYKNELNIDVTKYFQELKRFYLCQCCKTKYRFYFPFTMEGDGNFYQNLEKIDWYYMPWKWEHSIAKRLIKRTDKILEIGCGGLGFIDKMNNLNYNIEGLELNPQSYNNAVKKGLIVHPTTIQQFALKNEEIFDVVCSFQVVEHISEIHSFLASKIMCLKKSGKLIISVPNNDSFIRHSKGGILNFPPHHMGLWNRLSLKSLESLFEIRLEKIIFEPLQNYHISWYVKTYVDLFSNKNKRLSKFFNHEYFKVVLIFIVGRLKSFIRGHTIIAVYSKR